MTTDLRAKNQPLATDTRNWFRVKVERNAVSQGMERLYMELAAGETGREGNARPVDDPAYASSDNVLRNAAKRYRVDTEKLQKAVAEELAARRDKKTYIARHSDRRRQGLRSAEATG
jgi:hypothetical protein